MGTDLARLREGDAALLDPADAQHRSQETQLEIALHGRRTLAAMADGELIDRERNRRQFAERQAEFREHPDRARLFQRARVRILDNYRKEARIGPFTIQSDEHAPVGEGTAPSPLQYFTAAVGF